MISSMKEVLRPSKNPLDNTFNTISGNIQKKRNGGDISEIAKPHGVVCSVGEIPKFGRVEGDCRHEPP